MSKTKWKPSEDETFYWVTVPRCCSIADVKVKNAKWKGHGYTKNIFKTEIEAQEKVDEIKKIFGI